METESKLTEQEFRRLYVGEFKPIYEITDLTLNEVCRPVEPDEDVSDLITGMIGVLQSSGNGVGLAANQIGDNRRVIVIYTRELHAALINPVITKRGRDLVRSEEGCLSFDRGHRLRTVMRHKLITLQGLDWATRQPVKLKLRGLEARVAQHEIDHLNGITLFGLKQR